MANGASSIAAARARATSALRRPHNWVQLAKFCTVGAVGYVVNLGGLHGSSGAGLHYLLAAAFSFLVAVTNNYRWNRVWTFRGERGHVGYQGLRFLVVSLVALAANLVLLTCSSRPGSARSSRRRSRSCSSRPSTSSATSSGRSGDAETVRSRRVVLAARGGRGRARLRRRGDRDAAPVYDRGPLMQAPFAPRRAARS